MKKSSHNIAFPCLPLLIIFLCFTSVNGQTVQDNCQDHLEYEIREGDTLNSIALSFGSQQFEKLIKEANIEIFKRDDNLFAGQILRIPYKVYYFSSSNLSVREVLDNPLCETDTLNNKQSAFDLFKPEQSQEADTTSPEILEEFRTVFESLVEQERKEEQEKVQAGIEQQILLEIDGMVIDETRSKIGRDFYDVFYQYWQAPPNARRFTITISELPAPGLGTIIYVKVNDTETFRYRLQPRFDFIQEAGKYAVNLTYNHLREEQREFIIY